MLPFKTGELLHFTLRHAGTPGARNRNRDARAAPVSPSAGTENPGGKAANARLAINYRRSRQRPRPPPNPSSLSLIPLTISVLPNHEHSLEIAEEAHRRGFQVMLHLPMQSVANETPEAQELHPGMPAPEVAALVDQFLQNVPGRRRRQQSSGIAGDGRRRADGRVDAGAARDRHLFYVDSRTTAATVGLRYGAGLRSSLRFSATSRSSTDVAEVCRHSQATGIGPCAGAREKGEAVAIGHPHPATLRALREVLPQAQQQGVRLVLASETRPLTGLVSLRPGGPLLSSQEKENEQRWQEAPWSES